MKTPILLLFSAIALASATPAAAQPTFNARPPINYPDLTGNLVSIATGPGRRSATPTNGAVAVQAYTSAGAAGAQLLVANSGQPADVAVFDCDGDGRADLVVANTQARSVEVFYQDAAGNFASGAVLTSIEGPIRVAVGDLNADGRPDVVATSISPTGTGFLPNQLLVFMATGARTFASPAIYRRNASLGAMVGLTVRDFTGDNKPDVLLASDSGLSLSAGTAAGTLGPEQFTALQGTVDVAVADLNGDGRPDVVAGQQGINGVRVLLTTATGLGAPTTAPLSSDVNGVVVADLDNDGRPDVAATLNSNSVGILRGTATGTLLPATYVPVLTGSGYYGDLAADDFTGDGKPDLVLQDYGTSTGGATVLLRNTTGALPVELTAFTATRSAEVVQLAWTTASEKNSARFAVERSTDGSRFTALGSVAAAGTSSQPRAYQLTDAQLPRAAATLYYRLRQVDADSTFSYSPVRTVQVDHAAERLTCYPNPATGSFRVAGMLPGDELLVRDSTGRPVPAPRAADGAVVLLVPGLYVVEAWCPGMIRQTKVSVR